MLIVNLTPGDFWPFSSYFFLSSRSGVGAGCAEPDRRAASQRRKKTTMNLLSKLRRIADTQPGLMGEMAQIIWLILSPEGLSTWRFRSKA